MIAALFVLPDGPYIGLPDVDPWPESRDARLYPGPWPVVAHPPCARWGRYWHGSPSKPHQYALGDDGGCFASALAAVRQWGGVLEHPRDTRAWPAHGLPVPPPAGWLPTPEGGWVCCVDQGHYGHPAQKPTWLYCFRVNPRDLIWGSAPRPSRRPKKERARTRGVVELLSRRQRSLTPIPFRDLLLDLARSVPQPAVVEP